MLQLNNPAFVKSNTTQALQELPSVAKLKYLAGDHDVPQIALIKKRSSSLAADAAH